MKERQQRPAGHPYREEVQQRLGRGTSLCHIDAVGGANAPRRPYALAEGVAIIDISGVLTNEAWWWDETEYSEIQREVKMAVEDAEVKGILLRVASPGGETDNAYETAQVIADAGKKKPIWSAADNMAYSAGYLLACQGEKIYVSPTTGGVGSIGVYALHLDFSGYLEKAGIKPTFISAGKGKTDGNAYQPLSAEAEKTIRVEVERLYGEFVGHVSRARKMSEDKIRKIGAACFHGAAAALGAGLADRSGVLDQAWFEFATALSAPAQVSSMAASAAMTSPEKEDTKVSELNKADAAPAGEAAVDNVKLITDARTEGFNSAAEIVSLCKLARRPEMAADFITNRTSTEDVRKKLLDLNAEEAGPEINGRTEPATGAGSGMTASNNPLIAACERIASQMKGAA